MRKKHKILSLFANIGIAEANLNELGFDVVVANELDPRRAAIYQSIYPSTNMICGDITDVKIYKSIIEASKKSKVDIILATPPCQGMSTAGKLDKNDIRNILFQHAVDSILELSPTFFMFENVPAFMTTTIKNGDDEALIPDLIRRRLECEYHLEFNVVNAQNYGVPQSRERMILLGTKRGVKRVWAMPKPSSKLVTMKDAIGDLPPLDPYVRDISEEELKKLFPHFEERKAQALAISPWHFPPTHIYSNVFAMQHTPTGCSAFQNSDKYKPRKKNGQLVKGFGNTYKRQKWDTPAYTIAMSNNQISTQNSVHPGRLIGKDKDGSDIYSDARVLTIYELMRLMSIPHDWPIPLTTNKQYLRHIIGEGVPSLLVKRIFENI